MIRTAFEKIRFCLIEARIKEPVEMFIPVVNYRILEQELTLVQRTPFRSEGGIDLGIEICDQLKIKPLIELEEMRRYLKERDSRLDDLTNDLVRVFEKHKRRI